MNTYRIRKRLKRLWGCIRVLDNPYPVILAYYREERRIREKNKKPLIVHGGVIATPIPSGGIPRALHWYKLGWC